MLLISAPFVGSFLGVVARRLPAGRPILLGRSACDRCGRSLAAAELVPLFSYLLQRGRCRCGEARLDRFYPVIELAALAVVLSALPVAAGAELWLSAALGWTLLTLAAIDLAEQILPDVLTLPLLGAGLAATLWRTPDALLDHLIGAALGFLALVALNRLYRAIRGRDGLGLGDAKLLAAAGAWLGWAALPEVLLAAALAGLAGALVASWQGVALGAQSRIPFGPCLALGFWLCWLLALGGLR